MEVDTGTVRRRAGYTLGALGMVALVVVGGVLGRADTPADTTTPPADVTLPTATLPPATGSASPTAPAVAVSEVGPLMPTAAGWELFAQGQGVLARLELASGRVTRTVVPEIDSGGPLSVVAGPDRVLIRPGDAVAGYVVPDGRPAETLKAPTLGSGLLVPGPAPGLVWAQRDYGQPSAAYVLIDLDGRPQGPTIRLPPTNYGADSDGAGNLLLSDIGGAYQATPDGLRRITTGAVTAAGPTGWLVVDCDDRHRCTRVMVDRTTWARRTLGPAPDLYGAAGVIAPDGSTAAIINGEGVDSNSLHLIDLTTGADRAFPLFVDGYVQPGSLLWAPDSRSVFMVSGGKPVVVDARSGNSRVLVPDLPPMTLLAFRKNS